MAGNGTEWKYPAFVESRVVEREIIKLVQGGGVGQQRPFFIIGKMVVEKMNGVGEKEKLIIEFCELSNTGITITTGPGGIYQFPAVVNKYSIPCMCPVSGNADRVWWPAYKAGDDNWLYTGMVAKRFK